MKRLAPVLLSFLLVSEPLAAVELELIVEGLTAPIELADPDDGSGRLFVVEQQGLVSMLTDDGQLSATPLLDLRPHLLDLKNDFEERGLLGFALHPDFKSNGRVYVSYAAPLRGSAPKGWNYTRRIAELTLTPGAESVDLARSAR